MDVLLLDAVHGRPVLLLHHHGALVADHFLLPWPILFECFWNPLTVSVTRENPEARLGLGILKKKISLAEIKSVKAIDIPLTNRRQLWLCGKGRALQIITRDDEVLQFGSSDPETLVSFLEK